MHLYSTFTLIAVLASSFVVRADVVPSEPSPGSVYAEGQTCSIVWEGDATSQTLWKNMNIQLMTGDNFKMIHLTTVATNQDGTVSGSFEYPCPDVTVNSAIYFYQFTAPLAPNKTWTTRFLITSPTGDSTPPANAVQPGTNQPIPWGVGALSDPSKAVPPPASAGGGAAPASGSITASGPVLASTALPLPSTTIAPLSTSSSSDDSATPSSRLSVATRSSALASGASASPSSSATNSAIGMSATSAMTSLVLPALAFVMFL